MGTFSEVPAGVEVDGQNSLEILSAGPIKEVASGIKGHLWCDVDDVVFAVVHFLP